MNQLTPVLNEHSGEPLYMQLYRYIRDELTAGRIAPGTRLPSIRSLCANLRISRTPVAAAYEQLAAEGYVISKPRSGIVAALSDSLDAAPACAPSPRERGSAPMPLSRAYHAPPDEAIRYDFGYGSVDLSCFPLAKWRRLMNRCLLPENSRLLLYGDLQGERGLREQIAAYLHQYRGVRCSAEQVVVGAGTYHSLDLLLQLLKENVRVIASEQAVNDGVRSLFEQHRLECVPLPLEQDGIVLDPLYESKAQAVYVTPSHQFPFGMTMSINKRRKLLQWAYEREAYLIENDYDGEFRYSGRPIPSLQSLDDYGRVIYVGTFSRALTPAFRLSYVVLPAGLTAPFQQLKHSYDQLASPIFQQTLQWFMQSGDFERHMRKMRSIYQKKHHALLQAIQQAFREEAEVIGAGAGLHVLLEVRYGLSEQELILAAEQAGIRVYPASVYALNPRHAPASTVLLGFGGLSEPDIGEGVRLLAEAWRQSAERARHSRGDAL